MPPEISKILPSSDGVEDVITPQIGIQFLSMALESLDYHLHGPQGCFYNEDTKIQLSLGYSTVKEKASLAELFYRLGLKHPNVDILVQRYEPNKLKVSEVITLCRGLEETFSDINVDVRVMMVETNINPNELAKGCIMDEKLKTAISEATKELESIDSDSGFSPRLSILGVVENFIDTGRIHASDDVRESLNKKGVKPILHLMQT